MEEDREHDSQPAFTDPTVFETALTPCQFIFHTKWRKAESTIPNRLSPIQLFSKQRSHPSELTFHTKWRIAEVPTSNRFIADPDAFKATAAPRQLNYPYMEEGNVFET